MDFSQTCGHVVNLRSKHSPKRDPRRLVHQPDLCVLGLASIPKGASWSSLRKALNRSSSYPIHSMYGIYAYIDPQTTPTDRQIWHTWSVCRLRSRNLEAKPPKCSVSSQPGRSVPQNHSPDTTNGTVIYADQLGWVWESM